MLICQKNSKEAPHLVTNRKTARRFLGGEQKKKANLTRKRDQGISGQHRERKARKNPSSSPLGKRDWRISVKAEYFPQALGWGTPVGGHAGGGGGKKVICRVIGGKSPSFQLSEGVKGWGVGRRTAMPWGRPKNRGENPQISLMVGDGTQGVELRHICVRKEALQ